MVTEAKTHIECPKCKGLKIAQTQRGEEDPCQMCNGVGSLINGFVDVTNIMDKLDAIWDVLPEGWKP